MNYVFKGSLRGYLCEECFESISNVAVLLYGPWQKERVLANTVASTKDTFRLVTKEESNARENLLIATVKTDEKGNFEFILDEKYRDSAFDIDFICGTVPYVPPKPHREEPQFHLTTIYPQWKADREKEIYNYQWEYYIVSKWWCYIRGYFFDAWVICGHVHVCGTRTPISNLKVTAWDADFLTDDNLGSAVTDSNGHFRIDYSSEDFKRTFLSPFINVETDPGPSLTFQSGPDVYFKYEYNGITIIGETAADRRNNVGYCLCVNLCLKDIVIDPLTIPASFTRIGNNGKHFIKEDVALGDLNVIGSETGKTPAGQAFFSCISLTGNLTQKLNGLPMEYSFETVETTGPGNALETGVWKKVMASQMCTAEIGTFFNFPTPPSYNLEIVPYYVGPSGGVDANGWIAVPQDGNFAPNINGQILKLDTSSLNANDVEMLGLVQGQSTTTKALLQQNRFFKIRMIQRQVGNPASEKLAGVSNPVAMFNTVYKNVPKYGSWMPGKADEIGVACIDIQEMTEGSGTGCNPITDELHVNYTAANPNMGVVSLTLSGPGGPYSIGNLDPASSVPETFGTAQELTKAAVTIPVSNLPNCAYIVEMSVEIKLTDGENQHGNLRDLMSFCKSEEE